MANTNSVFRNPALRLMVSSSSEGVIGGGPQLSDEMKQRLSSHQTKLTQDIEILIKKYASTTCFDGRILIWAKMREDAINPGSTPSNLFLKTDDLALNAPWRDGYIVETSLQGLQELTRRLKNPSSTGKQYDIANIDNIAFFPDELLKDKHPSSAWNASHLDVGTLRLQTASYSTDGATRDVLRYLQYTLDEKDTELINYIADPDVPVGEDIDRPVVNPALHLPKKTMSVSDQVSQVEPIARQQYTIVVRLNNPETLRSIILSGSVVRWDPVENFSSTEPGTGEEPPLDRDLDSSAPIIGVIDGGYNANRYRNFIAWEAPKIIEDDIADQRHGNIIASIIVDAHLWSNELDLDDWTCRLGILQAIPKKNLRIVLPFEKVVTAIENAMIEHSDTMVWNLSANFDRTVSQYEVSEAAHLLSQVARKHRRLLVISAGNRPGEKPEEIAPPADCEAALVVTGRQADMLKQPVGPCPISRTAFGPDFMTKPDLSWYSEQRILGGNKSTGTSYAAPLVSRLAAHCFENIEDPSPDLVRALMINSADLPKYCKFRGFGTPSTDSHPWLSTDSSILLAWTERIKAQARNRWAGIVIPPSMIKDGRIWGRIKLVAVLEPRVQRRGDQYIATRLETSIHVLSDGEWDTKSILKPLQSITREKTARSQHAKWQTTQCFEGKWEAGKGPKIDPDNPYIRVGGRIYWRHKYMFGQTGIKEQEHEVSFAMTLEAADPKADTYNEFRQLMDVNVSELAIEIGQEIEGEE